jgi:hypothetical protein
LPHLLIDHYRSRYQTQVIMAGLDNIDPAVLCLDGGAARACRRARAWQAERVSDFVDKRRHSTRAERGNFQWWKMTPGAKGPA